MTMLGMNAGNYCSLNHHALLKGIWQIASDPKQNQPLSQAYGAPCTELQVRNGRAVLIDPKSSGQIANESFI